MSLDAAGRVACVVGRSAAGLPYHHARMSMGATSDGWVRFESDRRTGTARFDGRYRPIGAVRPPSALERFLTERDGLWSMRRPGVAPDWLAIRHDPWPLQDADAAITTQSMTAASALSIDRPPDHLAFSRCVDVVAWRRARP